VTLTPFRVQAYVNWGRWVVPCPRCPSALGYWSDAPVPDITTGTPVFRCWECDTRAEIEWPSEEMVHGIERLLLMRPDVTTQNWLPGETLVDLMWENGAHGILSDLPTDLDLQLVVEPERIRVDTLPLTHRRELKAIG
jgi:hypothetical protein